MQHLSYLQLLKVQVTEALVLACLFFFSTPKEEKKKASISSSKKMSKCDGLCDSLCSLLLPAYDLWG